MHTEVDSAYPTIQSGVTGGGCVVGQTLSHSQSNPDLIMSACYEDLRNTADYPEHVLKVSSCDIFLIYS